MKEKQDLIEHYYIEIIDYLNRNINNYNFSNDERGKYLKLLLTKYTRIVESIKELDLKGLHQECDILIRTLNEMLIDIGYLELDKNKNYKIFDLFTSYQMYELIIERCNDDNIDINSLNVDPKIINDHDVYKNNFLKKKDRWSGISYFNEAEELDEVLDNPIIPFVTMFKKIYRINCLNSHNSGIILNSYYKYLDIEPVRDGMYLHNINNIVILTGLLTIVCLKDIFKEQPTMLYEFDTFMGGLNLVNEVS